MTDLGIIVHPFFGHNHFIRTKCRLGFNPKGEDEKLTAYLRAIIGYLQSPRNQSLVLEESRNLSLSKRVTDLIDTQAQLIWIPTRKEKSIPSRGWKELYKEIDAIKPSKLILMGGYYTLVDNERHGCLATVEEKLKERGYNLEVDLPKTF